MKKQFTIPHSFIFIFIIVALVFLSIAVVTPSHQSQDPPPEQTSDLSLEVGSTDGITLIAFIITGVIILPLITSGTLTRKKNLPQK